MINISSLGKVSGVALDEWFIPAMFNALELDNSFVLWSSLESEYYADTVNNLLMIKFFVRKRRSFDLNVKIANGNIYIRRNMDGNYYRGKKEPVGFRLPQVGDYLLKSENTHEITNVVFSHGDILIEVLNQETFISGFSSPSVTFIDGTTEKQMYTDSDGVYYTKQYKSDNVADVYIDGKDIRSIAGRYL
jgi:hypothetical protein